MQTNCRAASRRRRRLYAALTCRLGQRTGRYWIAGDVQGTRGKSLFVKLFGDGAGRWTDAATGEHGDLLDLIGLNKGFSDFRETLQEARFFMREPERVRSLRSKPLVCEPQRDTLAAAEKLHRFSRPVTGTLAETYLRSRAITAKFYWPSLRFHPACYYRPDDGRARQSWPALLGIVSDLDGNLTGLQRTWLARDGSGKAPLPIQGAPWVICSATRCASASRRTSWPPAKASRPCSRFCRSFRPCPWPQASRRASRRHPVPARSSPSLCPARQRCRGRFCGRPARRRCRDASIECRVLKPAAKDLNADLRAGPVHAVKARMLAQMEPKTVPVSALKRSRRFSRNLRAA